MPHKSLLNKLQFRHQLVLVFVLGIIILAVATSFAVSRTSSQSVRAQMIEQGLNLVDSFGRQSRLALLYQSGENASEVAATTLDFPNVIGVQVLTDQGISLLTRGDVYEPLAPYEDYDKPTLIDEDEARWVFISPVLSEGFEDIWSLDTALEPAKPDRLGSVLVIVSKSSLHAMERRILRGNFIVSLSISVLLLLILLWLTRRLTVPLNRLSGVMRRAEDGEINLRAQIGGPRDIADMQHAFNTMMAVLERRELELRHARDLAVESANVKAEFAANVSHELRTPMNAVLGMLDLLSSAGLSSKQHDYVETAKSSGQRLLGLIDDILNFAQVDSGKVILEEHHFALEDLLEDVLDLLSAQAMRKGLNLGYHMTTEVPAYLYADASRIRQVLINLVGNAVKFTELGEVAIRVDLMEAKDKSPAMLRFRVEDTGIGISPQAQENIFEAFTQEDSTTTKKYGGTGLGLAICRQLVTLMGGEIRVSSQSGQGSTFWFTVPFSGQRHNEIEEDNVGVTLPGQRVLFVDDSPVGRDFAETWFRRAGAEVVLAESGLNVLEEMTSAAAAGQSFDYLFLDENLSGIGITDLLNMLSRQAFPNEQQVVVMVNPWVNNDLSYAKEGMVLEKPLSSTRLRNFFGKKFEASEAPHTEQAPVLQTIHKKVLVVDDNKPNRQVAGGMLEQLGCECEFATNGKEALDILGRKQFDIILMDCNMPVLDGYDATRQIRRFENTATAVPIIAMTANTNPGDTKKCLDVGMNDVVSKPLSLKTLQAKLAKWVGDIPSVDIVGNDVPVATQGEQSFDPVVMQTLKNSVGEVFTPMVEAFLEDIPIYIQGLKTALASNDTQQVYELSHTIKGSASNFGAIAVVDMARQLEEKGRYGDLTGAEKLFNDLVADYSALGQDLEDYLSRENEQRALNKTSSTILIVDDDRGMRMAFTNALRDEGYRILEASNGQAALSVCERSLPDMVLMDAIMPELDGFAACEKIRGMAQGEEMPILMVTALEDEQSIARAFAVGATDYIPKPVNFSVLRQRVSRLLQTSKVERHVRRLAYHDALTGLPNRAYLIQQLRHKISRANLNEGRLAVLFLDLDRFKIINDSLGHDAGDLILKAAADRIKRCVRENDLVARLGGDEFTVILEDIPSQDVASHISKKICAALNKPFVFLQQKMFVTVSIGISTFPDDGTDISTLLKHADTAMFKAKEKGNSYCFYQMGMEDEITNRLEMERDLRAALETNEILLHYQPQKNLVTGETEGVEALVRWQHPKQGMVPAGVFVPLAEESGLIAELGAVVFRQACEQLESWYKAGIRTRMSVNVSGGELHNGELREQVVKLLDKYQLPTELLEIEITETMLMDEPEMAQLELSALREMGVSIAIDDFGSGFSSLNYLKRFSVDVLKIDRAFVKDCHVDKNDQAIIQGIITLAHSLGLKVVAEGVEFPEQEAFLRHQGCDLVQGYLISRPVPAAEVEKFLMHATEKASS